MQFTEPAKWVHESISKDYCAEISIFRPLSWHIPTKLKVYNKDHC